MKEKYGIGSEQVKSSKDVRKSILKVVNKPYKHTYTNGINIQGEYLKQYGFRLGNEVAVMVSQNRILIEKLIDPEEIEQSENQHSPL